VYIVKQKQIKDFAEFIKKISMIFKMFKKRSLMEAIFENLIIHKPSLGSREVPHKNFARSVQPLYIFLDINGQTEKQSIYLDSEINPKDINTKNKC